MKVCAIIQARLSSERFPRKVLAKIGDKTMLQMVIDNVNKSTLVNQVVVAIPKGQKIPFENAEKFEGDELDVLDRYYQCALKYQADTIVRITADCPLVSGDLIDTTLRTYLQSQLPYIIIAPCSGQDVEVFSFRMLHQAWEATKGIFEFLYHREHVTYYMQKITDLSVDTPDDLEKVKKWINGKILVN